MLICLLWCCSAYDKFCRANWRFFFGFCTESANKSWSELNSSAAKEAWTFLSRMDSFCSVIRMWVDNVVDTWRQPLLALRISLWWWSLSCILWMQYIKKKLKDVLLTLQRPVGLWKVRSWVQLNNLWYVSWLEDRQGTDTGEPLH